VQSPSWEANWFAASQEIPRISRNPKVHYRTHKRPPTVSILASPIQSIHPHPTFCRSILILPTHLRLGLPSGSFPPVTYLLTYSTVQSPSWEANWFAASQVIPHISRNPKVHYRTHKRSPPVSILGQPNPVHIRTSHLLQIHPNITRPSMPRSPQWSPTLRFPHQDPIHPLTSPLFNLAIYVRPFRVIEVLKIKEILPSETSGNILTYMNLLM